VLSGVISNFGWLYVIAATVFTIFVIIVAASGFGRIPRGRDGEEPQFRTASWISMMFAPVMGIGLVFYGVGEPLFFYMSPPPGTVKGQTPEAMTTALGTTLFHWPLYPWAMYAIVGLGMPYGTYLPGPLAAVLLDAHLAVRRARLGERRRARPVHPHRDPQRRGRPHRGPAADGLAHRRGGR